MAGGLQLSGNFTQPEVMAAYQARLIDSSSTVRALACDGLKKMGTKASKTKPLLEKLLQDKEAIVRVYAAQALYAVDPSAVCTVVHLLTEALLDSDNFVRRASAEGLGNVGPAARTALPALRRALEDDWSDVRTGAATAISKIEKK